MEIDKSIALMNFHFMLNNDKETYSNHCYASAFSLSSIKDHYEHFIELATSSTLAPHMLVVLLDTIKRSAIPEVKETLIEFMRDEFNTFQLEPLLSTAMSPRAGLTLIYRDLSSHQYLILTTDDMNQQYYYYLATLLLEYSHDKDLVIRITKAITKREPLELTEEEIKAVDISVKYRSANIHADILSKLIYSTNIDFLKAELENDMQNITEQLEAVRERYRQLLKQDMLQKFMGSKQDEELTEYLLESDNIQDISVDGRRIRITYKSYLRLDDSDDFFKGEPYKNDRHILYNRREVYELLQEVRAGKLLIPIYAGYRITTRGDTFTIDKTETPMIISKACLVNPHIARHNCFTGYRNMMLQALHDGDIIGMLEVMNQCTGSINVYDGAVITSFISSLQQLQYDIPIKYKKNNKIYDSTIGEYYAKIKTNNPGTESVSDDDSTGAPIF